MNPDVQTLSVTLIKIIMSVYGAVGGFLILLINESYEPDVIAGPYWGDLPAALFGVFLENTFPTKTGHIYLGWHFILSYVLLGLVGGWGLGQTIDWLLAKRNYKG
ncbi:MAG: hypothetical protein ACYC6O_08580 [Thermoleophilia bacterium]